MQRTPTELKAQAVWLRKSSAAKCISSGDPKLDKQVWDQTMDEVQSKWLAGPFTENQVHDLVGSQQWLATRRFPLVQGDKVRLIDDALVSGLNSGYGASNKLHLFDVDVLVALILRVGKELPHRSSLWGDSVRMVGRTLDLSSAYKQLGAFMDEQWQRIIVVYDPNSKSPRYFVAHALMFGSVAAVYGFNRVSRSIWHILAVKLRLLALIAHCLL